MSKIEKASQRNKLDYKIIKSGSSGNAIRVENVMFECGVPFKDMEEELYKVRYLIITHKHSDHLNMTTYKRIRRKFPRIKFIANWSVASVVPIDEITGDSTTIETKDWTIESFPAVHDVPCHGYVLKKDGLNILYITDTSTMEHAPDYKYDYFFMESNHDESKINAVRNNSKKLYGYDVWEGAMRHLSIQKAKAFYWIHRRNESSPFIELHKSERFY